MDFDALQATMVNTVATVRRGLRDNPGLTGTGADPTTSVALGAVLELVLIVANVGSRRALRGLLAIQRRPRAGYVAVRLVEGVFIAIGILSLLTFVFMRQEGAAGTNPLSARLRRDLCRRS